MLLKYSFESVLSVSQEDIAFYFAVFEPQVRGALYLYTVYYSYCQRHTISAEEFQLTSPQRGRQLISVYPMTSLGVSAR